MKKIQFWGAACLFIVILMNPQTAVISAQRAMNIWYSSVAPTLFPFLVLMPLLSGKEACAAYGVMFSKFMRILFGLPGTAAPAIVVGMIAGSPGGAIALRKVAANSNMTSAEVQRIALAVAGVSPAYLIIGVGQVLFGSISLGVKLAIIQICIQLLLLIILPRKQSVEGNMVYLTEEDENGNPISSAVGSLIGICGYMVFFSVAAGVLASLVGRRIGGWLLLAIDLPSGVAQLASAHSMGKLALTGMAVGFGGLCIASQNMQIYKGLGLRWKNYLRVRGIVALLFGCVCGLMEAAGSGKVEALIEVCMKNYAAALFIAGIMALPGLIFLSRKYFLNNQVS